jgi:hypothetical protein
MLELPLRRDQVAPRCAPLQLQRDELVVERRDDHLDAVLADGPDALQEMLFHR